MHQAQDARQGRQWATQRRQGEARIATWKADAGDRKRHRSREAETAALSRSSRLNAEHRAPAEQFAQASELVVAREGRYAPSRPVRAPFRSSALASPPLCRRC